MSRLLDYRPEDEQVIVDRVLSRVHAVIDRDLPSADKAPQRYGKTVFSDDENTAIVKAGKDIRSEFGHDEPTNSLEPGSVSNADIAFAEASKEFTSSGGGDTVETMMGAEFTGMYDEELEKSSPGFDLLMLAIGLILLISLAVAYWYIFEM